MKTVEAQVKDTAVIQRLISRARFRIRMQGALEGATTATIIAAAAALASIFAMRTELVSGTTGLVMLAGAGAIIVMGALLGALKQLDDEVIARRIDRASNLSDRLSTAIAFRRTLATSPAASSDSETVDLMVAAIRDGVKASPRANIKAATPFSMPKDLGAAFGFLAISALAAGLAVPTVDRTPRLVGADPDHGRPGTEVNLRGQNLLVGVTAPVAALPAHNVIGVPNPPVEATTTTSSSGGFVPSDAYIYLGPVGKGRPIEVIDWTRDTIRVRIPADAPIGDTLLTAYIGKQTIGPVAFTVVDPKDSEFHPEDSVLLDADERAYVESILAQLKDLAKREKIEDLDKFIAKIEQLLKDAEEGKVTKEQLLAELAKAEELLNQGMEPNQAEIAKKMGEMGKELKKSELTKELGQALEKNDLDKAKQELEELARKLEKSAQEKKLEELQKQLDDKQLTEQEKQDVQKKLEELKKDMEKEMKELEKQLKENKELTDQQKQDLQKKLEDLKKEKPLTEKQKEELQKQMENVSKQMQKQDDKDKQQQTEQQQKLEDQIRRLQKDKEAAKNDQERLNAERQLQKKKDELQKLQKDNDQKDQSAQRQALKRLQRDMEKAAEQLQKPNKQESQDEKEEREKQASQKIKDAARETGKVDQDQRKQAQQKKMSSQMDDLREAMRRAKQKGNKGGNDPFGKNAKNQDFDKRKRGQKGSGQAWKPGQGQQPGQGQPGGQGKQPGGQQWGVGHEDDMAGDATDKTGKTKDEDVTGETGNKGTSRRETILAAAQKGFASTSYKKVYADYQRIVEEVMRTEKLPSSYKYYVKRYFAKIHPSGSPESVGDSPIPAPTEMKSP